MQAITCESSCIGCKSGDPAYPRTYLAPKLHDVQKRDKVWETPRLRFEEAEWLGRYRIEYDDQLYDSEF